MSVTTDLGAGTIHPAPAAWRERWHARINRSAGFFELIGFGWLVPLMRMAAGDDVKAQGKALWRALGVPLSAIVIFLCIWAFLAPKVKTSLGLLPGPAQVWVQAENLWADHIAERAKAHAFYERQEKRNAEILAKDPTAVVKNRLYTGKPTFLDQIVTSLETVFTGFLLASIVAIPLGILCGLFANFNAAINPLVQIFKPVSPLAWLPIVTMVVSALYVSDDPLFPKSFLVSAITVTLCSLWPTLAQHRGRRRVDRQGSGQCQSRAEAVLAQEDLQARAAVGAAADVHRFAPVARRRLDGADRGRDAGAKSGTWKIRLGRVPERFVGVAREDHGGGDHHRPDRLRAGSRDAGPAGDLHPRRNTLRGNGDDRTDTHP